MVSGLTRLLATQVVLLALASLLVQVVLYTMVDREAWYDLMLYWHTQD